MLVIRLARTGRKKRPNYRVVVAEKSAPIKGRFLEVLGHYDPRTKELVIDEDKAKQRLAAGAQPSETAEALLEKAGILKRAKVSDKHRRPTRQKKNPVEETAAPAAAAPASNGAAQGDEAADSTEGPAPSDDDTPAVEPAASDGPGETTANPPDTTEEADTDREGDQPAAPSSSDPAAPGDDTVGVDQPTDDTTDATQPVEENIEAAAASDSDEAETEKTDSSEGNKS